MEYFYVYILQSEIDNSYYLGYTGNLEKRLKQHNTARSDHTATKKPWKLVYKERFESKSEAIKRERFLKSKRTANSTRG